MPPENNSYQIQRLIQSQMEFLREQYLEDDLRDKFEENVLLRPGVTEERILSCEQFIGRSFSPSYRQFLSLYDGCQGLYQDEGLLLGTLDYFDSTWIAWQGESAVYSDIYAYFWKHAGDWFPDWPVNQFPPPDAYNLGNFYHSWDTHQKGADKWSLLRQAVAQEEERGKQFLFYRTLIGVSPLHVIVLDHTTQRSDGEMDVILATPSNGTQTRYSTFTDMLTHLIGDDS